MNEGMAMTPEREKTIRDIAVTKKSVIDIGIFYEVLDGLDEVRFQMKTLELKLLETDRLYLKLLESMTS